MHRDGHVGISLLLYSPIVILVGHAAEELLVPVTVGAALLADVFLPFRLVARFAFGRRVRLSFSPAMLPDLDMKIPGVKHRGITHTVWFALGVAVVTVVLCVSFLSLVFGVRGEQLLIAGGFVGYLALHSVVTHILGDVVTPAGIRPFAPVKHTKYSFGLVKAANPIANALCYLCGLLAVAGAIALSIG